MCLALPLVSGVWEPIRSVILILIDGMLLFMEIKQTDWVFPSGRMILPWYIYTDIVCA